MALEASAAGVAVVATAVGGTPEVIEDRVTGHLVPAGDPQALARRILEVFESDEERRALGEQGRHRVQNLFSFERQAAQYVELFQSLASQKEVGNS